MTRTKDSERPKLASLQPSVGMVKPSLGTIQPSPITQRMRGRKLQTRRQRWFSLHPLCIKCDEQGRVRPATELDHTVPLFKGGADDETNLQGLCATCHAEKTAEDLKGTGGTVRL